MPRLAQRGSLRRRIWIGYGVLLLAALLFLGLTRFAFHAALRSQDEVAERTSRNLNWAHQLEVMAARAESGSYAYAQSGAPQDLGAVQQAWQQFELIFEALHESVTDARSRAQLDEVRRARDAERDQLAAFVQGSRRGQPMSAQERSGLIQTRGQLAVALDDLTQSQRGLRAEARQATLRSSHEEVEATSVLSIAGVVLAAVGAFLYSRIVAAAVERDQAQERFRVLVDGIQEYAIALLDEKGQVESWNPAAERMFGFTAVEVLRRPYELFYPHDPLGQSRAARALDTAVRRGRVDEQGWRLRKDGSPFWATSVLAPIRDRDGEVRGYSFICRDTSAHRRAEQERAELLDRERNARHELQGAMRALQKSEQRERSLYEANLIGVFFFNPEGQVLGANDAFLSLLGQPRSVLQGPLQLDSILVADGGEPPARTLRELRSGGTLTPVPATLIARGGRKVPVLLGAAGIEDSVEGVGFVLDTTERKRAEDALRFLSEASGLLSTSLDYATTLARVARLAVPQLADWCMVELEDQEGTLRRMAVVHRDEAKDELAQKLLGPLPGSLPRPPVLGTGEPELVEDMGELMREVAAGPGEREVVEELGFEAAMVVPLFVRHRAMGAMLLVASDPNREYHPADLELAVELAQRCAAAVDNARLYLEAQEAIRARDDFLSIASHELKTPLTSLKLMVHALKKQEGQPIGSESVDYRLAGIERQATRVARLTDELLDISRIRLGRLELDLQEVDLGEVSREVVQRFREESVMRGSPVRLDIDGSPHGRWDRSRVEQVVSNLLSNALKYGAGRPIEVKVQQLDGVARISVRDEGIGIPLDQQARIFERFERAVSSRHFGGLGLGLYIVRQIVSAHGGEIRLQSRPNAGSTFIVDLPMRPARQLEESPSAMHH